MKSEIVSMEINNVWTLVDPSKRIKSIGYKKIFKRKKGANKKVEIYKTHLVVKSYRQHYGIDYDETFSPMVMLKSIRMIFAITAYLDYEI